MTRKSTRLLALIPVSLALLGCEGTYERQGICYHYTTYPDGTTTIIECESSTSITVKTKSLREFIEKPTPAQGASSPTAYYYYYRTEAWSGTTLLDSWEYDSFTEFQSIFPEVLDAAGISYSQSSSEYSYAMSYISSRWETPEDNWNEYN